MMSAKLCQGGRRKRPGIVLSWTVLDCAGGTDQSFDTSELGFVRLQHAPSQDLLQDFHTPG